ncbi:S24 family peptidase [uncultured Prevotella sp.]|uniref:S24 family peptidase n=1 Tax=uncultured Prevotella sp. TaxID=159272 RepID=UPI002598DEDC|nr:S24 family peptidase [uncultured Prevotella sp.]
MSETIHDRIKELVTHFGDGANTVFANIVGVSEGNVRGYIKGVVPKQDFLEKVVRNCEVNPQWLLTGEGSMLKGNDLPAKVSYDPAVGTPYYDVDFIGGFSEIFSSQTKVPACNVLVPGFEKTSLWCNVTGHSMEPKINHGDIIALHECTINDIQFGEIYAVVLDTIRTIKILRRGSTPDKLLYVPINKPDYEEQEFDISRIIKVFEVIGSISKFF